MTKLLTLQKLQNRAARIVTKSKFDTPAMELIHNLNWPTVSDIIRSETATTMYKSLNGLVPEYLSNLFVKNSTRNVRELTGCPRKNATDLNNSNGSCFILVSKQLFLLKSALLE